MIEAEQFIEAAREYGFLRYTGVPCSFLTPFINYVINDPTLNYISSANEGDALATAAGAAIGGERAVVMMQNSGLGNAVSPITSLAYVFRIPMLIITTHRGQPGLKDEPQHELMGKITGDMLDTMQVPWEIFPKSANEVGPALKRAMDYMQRERRPYAFIMHKGTVNAHALNRQAVPHLQTPPAEIIESFSHAGLPSRNELLQKIITKTPIDNCIVIATTGYTGRELYAINDRPNQLYMVGSMGCASSLGLGLALARPESKVIVVDGDGAALMRMGNFSTLGSYAGSNLYHIVLDNEVHDSTGAQATVSCNVRFAEIARACSYARIFAGNTPTIIDRMFEEHQLSGPSFAHVKIQAGTIENLPRPSISPEQVLDRLMQQIGQSF